MTPSPLFKGACTALITPFRNGKIDYPALSRLIHTQIDAGISALLVAGSTGEAASLTYAEHRDLLRFAVHEVGHRVPLIAGTGSNDTGKAVRMTAYACDYGVDGVLVVTPYYNKTSADGLVAHFHTIADASSVPVILYNVPSRTGMELTPALYQRLASHPRITSVKEASPSLSNFAMTQALCGGELDLFAGNDDLLLPCLALGACGIISVMSNLFPAEVGMICTDCDEGRYDEARRRFLVMLPFARALFSEVNPLPIKTVCAACGLCSEEFRLPLIPLGKEKREELLRAYQALTEELKAV